VSLVRHLAPRWLALSALLGHGAAAGAQAGLTVPLDCRIGDGQWTPCTMTVQRIGELWWLQVGPQRFEFRSDGRGSTTLGDGAGTIRAVQPVWQGPRALCWDGICAKGELPLD
jgi:hypothetical protein